MTPASTTAIIICAFVALFIGIAIIRARTWRVGVPWMLAVALLIVAWVDPRSPFASKPTVALLVDASPSTRGFWFRETDAVRSIAATLKAFAHVNASAFADGRAVALDLNQAIEEIDADESTLPTTQADAIVMLSDGQLTPSHEQTPVFAIVDESRAGDARLIDASHDRGTLSVRIDNDGGPRELTWPDGARERIEPDTTILRRILAAPATGALNIELNAGDRWPENDRLIVPVAPARLGRLWIGESAPEGFESTEAKSLDLTKLLGAGVVVLNDVPIDALPSTFQQDLARYVRDLGGSVVIGGGNHSLSAGGYGNTLLDALSPLSSLPPAPTNDLFVLVDSSGSMATSLADGRTKLDVAVDAVYAIDRVVPDTWTLRAGSIARDLRWWMPADADRVKRPDDLIASGPTNLAVAIEAVMDVSTQKQKRLILLSDGQAEADSLTAIAQRVKESGIQIDWLALPTANASGAPANPNDAPVSANDAAHDPTGPLAKLVRASGGRILLSGDASRWRADAEALARSALAVPMIVGEFDLALPILGPLSVKEINQTFPRDRIQPLASASIEGSDTPVLATWNVGVGRVTTLAFALDPAALGAFASAQARSPHDPRFTTRIKDEAIEVDARDANGPMNLLPLTLQIDESPPTPSSLLIPHSSFIIPHFPQVAPGQYRVPLDRSDQARIASVRLDQSVIDILPIPARASREFDQIGTDVDALRQLCESTGGKLIRRDQIDSIRTSLAAGHSPSIRVPALLAAMFCMAFALVAGHRSSSS